MTRKHRPPDSKFWYFKPWLETYHKGFRLVTWPIYHGGRYDYQVGYELTDLNTGDIVFSTEFPELDALGPIDPAPSVEHGSLAEACAIMFYLTLGEHDTDAEFFSKYSKRQLEFRDKCGEELNFHCACREENYQRRIGRKQ